MDGPVLLVLTVGLSAAWAGIGLLGGELGLRRDNAYMNSDPGIQIMAIFSRRASAFLSQVALPPVSSPCEAPEAVAANIAAEGIDAHKSQQPL